MKKLLSCWTSFKTALSHIHLVDKCLIVMLLILLIQSSYSLFFQSDAVTDSNNIDVIIRTSAAAIFGYFLSANFIRNSSKPRKSEPQIQKDDIVITKEVSKDQTIDNKIGFKTPTGEEQNVTSGSIVTTTSPDEDPDDIAAGRLQILVATFMGIFCLVTLILLRNYVALGNSIGTSPSASATVVQFRDFVSGCIGFLIGCPTSGSKKS